MKNNIIPIFYACDDSFIKYTVVSLNSMIKNASCEYKYHIHILNTNISEESKAMLTSLADDKFEIFFDDVSHKLDKVIKKHHLPVRDYYSLTTYFRFFIADMFPRYDKAIYIDGDTVVNCDISALFNIDLGDRYLAACHDPVVDGDPFGLYVERVVGVPRALYFNAGLMLINCLAFRENSIFERFLKCLELYEFKVAQDQDYLNLIANGHTLLLDPRWNSLTASDFSFPENEAKIIHYNMVNKPWHYHNCKCADFFWQYAKDTCVYNSLITTLNNYTDEERQRDAGSAEQLLQMAVDEISREDNFFNVWGDKLSLI